jgi:two-component system, cell cycle sensor histidine kinase and response regulator CckA
MKTNGTEKGTVLVANDHPEDLQTLIAALQACGTTILVARQGEHALDLAGQFTPDVILLDVRMPDMDGIETCRRLRAQASTQTIPVIFLIASGEIAAKVAGCELGCVDYLTKPFQPHEVIARVTAYLTIRRLQQQVWERDGQEHRNFREAVEAYEKRLIVSTLEQHSGNMLQTAERLHIPLRTLYRKIKKYRLL